MTIEGGVGAGKTALMKTIECQDLDEVELIPEPIEKWMNYQGENLLEKFYKEPRKYAAVFQTYVAQTLVERQLRMEGKPIVIMERSMASSLLFAEYLMMDKGLTELEYNVICGLYKLLGKLQPEVQADAVVYIKTSPKTLLGRIHSRGRKGEETSTLERLTLMEGLHREYYVKGGYRGPVLQLDGDVEIEHLMDEWEGVMNWIHDRRNDWMGAGSPRY